MKTPMQLVTGLPKKLIWDREMFDLRKLTAFNVTLHRQSKKLSEGVKTLSEIINSAVVESWPIRKASRLGRKATVGVSHS